ncbi:7608_t:CDS:2, partial [Acaulospora morrowiae]
KTSTNSSLITIEDEENELEVLAILEFVDETSLADQEKQTDKALTKDQATSSIPNNSTCNRATSPIDQTNDITKIHSSRQLSQKLQELSMPIKGETDEDDVNE